MRGKSIKILVALAALALFFSLDASAMIGSSNQAIAQNNQWIPVPAWLAGTWQTRFQTFLETYDCKTGQQLLNEPTSLPVARQRTIGAQQDATGQIWHYAATPYVRNVETEAYFESQTIQKLSVLHSHSNLVSLNTLGVVSRWSRETQEKLDSFYESTVATYIPLNAGVIKTDLNVTDYDLDGKPLRASHSVCVERCIKPFVVIDRDERGDLREKFLRFLAERNATALQSDASTSLLKNGGAK